MHESSKILSMTPGIFASWFHLALGTVRVFVFNGYASERVREIDIRYCNDWARHILPSVGS